ncbi:DUF2017 family protein [Micropruina sp.]|uniref:DUF2017 family protein n=1 Tax=Micropruina sp. TaxID=2737536 RepID=UPI0039E5F148
MEQAQVVLSALIETNAGRDPVVVRSVDLEAWLKTIAAIRLTLSVRLGIETADDIDALERLDKHEPRAVLYGMYEWLGYFLESLIDKAH